MLAWNSFVGLLSVVLSLLTSAYGGNLGWAIVTLSLVTRLALLPFAMRVARRTQAQQRVLAKLDPDIRKLMAKYKSRPQRLSAELRDLYQRHNVKTADPFRVVMTVLELLVGAGVYSAIKRGLSAGGRFFWVRDLAQPDWVLAITTAAFSFGASFLAPHLSQSSRLATAALVGTVTLLFVWRLASGVVLYWLASTTVSGVQTIMLSRGKR